MCTFDTSFQTSPWQLLFRKSAAHNSTFDLIILGGKSRNKQQLKKVVFFRERNIVRYLDSLTPHLHIYFWTSKYREIDHAPVVQDNECKYRLTIMAILLITAASYHYKGTYHGSLSIAI